MQVIMEESRRYEVELPGFRFHPTEEELLSFYLRSTVLGSKFRCCDIIGFLNIYKYDPRDLPALAKIGEREWYFFVPRDRKHGSGGRPNRTTETGFWKATGSDRKILSTSDHPKKLLGLKKTLVFYEGRAPHGTKTNWVMNEYRLPDKTPSPKDDKDIVLCKIYMKATSLKVLEQRAAMEEDNTNTRTSCHSTPSPPMSSSFTNQFEEAQTQSYSYNNNNMGIGLLKKESQDEDTTTTVVMRNDGGGSRGRIWPGSGRQNLAELQVPYLMDWTQDPIWSQLSPCLENLTPYLPTC